MTRLCPGNGSGARLQVAAMLCVAGGACSPDAELQGHRGEGEGADGCWLTSVGVRHRACAEPTEQDPQGTFPPDVQTSLQWILKD